MRRMSKGAAGAMLLGGIAMTIICGNIASAARGSFGAPAAADDWLWDAVGWAATIGAFAGLAVFFWGAKIFSAADTRRRRTRRSR